MTTNSKLVGAVFGTDMLYVWCRTEDVAPLHRISCQPRQGVSVKMLSKLVLLLHQPAYYLRPMPLRILFLD